MSHDLIFLLLLQTINFLIVLCTAPLLLLAIFVVECFEIGHLAIPWIIAIVVYMVGRYMMGQQNGKLRFEIILKGI